MNLTATHIMRRVEPMQTKWVELANETSGLRQNRADDKPSGKLFKCRFEVRSHRGMWRMKLSGSSEQHEDVPTHVFVISA